MPCLLKNALLTLKTKFLSLKSMKSKAQESYNQDPWSVF